jgi:uncharacterized protein YgbK (DUF1537 family)
MAVLLGAIADDFTGATDLANTLVGQGMHAVQVIGVPEAPVELGDAEAVVVALKSRTAPVAEAVADALGALAWLRAQGAEQIFFKYCSTFDSTADGNIGPVADALLDALDDDFALVCPAFPANDRSVYMGHLFVGGLLLEESPMKDHPLTPMTDSHLVRLMAAQSTKRVGLIRYPTVEAGVETTRAAIAELRADGIAYGVADALTDEDLLTLGAAATDHRLITGGSGLALGLPANFRRRGLLGEPRPAALPAAQGPALVLAGSCSQATRGQVAHVREDWPSLRLDVDRLAADEPVAAEAVTWARAQDPATPLLIYASADPEEVAATQARHGRERAGALVEAAFGHIARELVAAGWRRLVVAGGETSGAVVSSLGVRALRIGPEIDPGVPWTETLDAPHLALALKSGNFGSRDFFAKALGMLGRAT